MKYIKINFWLLVLCLLTSCQFHLQGQMQLAAPLHRLYLQTPDPYGYLARSLRDYLRMSHVTLVDSPNDADTILAILRDDSSQQQLSVSVSQQTRQYELRVTVTFEIRDKLQQPLISPQTLTEARTITMQSNQILGSSNEANLFYQQMHRTLSYTIMSRIASKEITDTINQAVLSKKSIKP